MSFAATKRKGRRATPLAAEREADDIRWQSGLPKTWMSQATFELTTDSDECYRFDRPQLGLEVGNGPVGLSQLIGLEALDALGAADSDQGLLLPQVQGPFGHLEGPRLWRRMSDVAQALGA
jgi:hypothetical protein